MSQCPGQDMRKLTSELIKCPTCCGDVEMFSDEYRRRCPNCKSMVEREAIPSCATYCAAAKDCLGADRYEEFMRTRMTD